jgi:hypothetical protein
LRRRTAVGKDDGLRKGVEHGKTERIAHFEQMMRNP